MMTGLLLLGVGLLLAMTSVMTAMRPERAADGFWS